MDLKFLSFTVVSFPESLVNVCVYVSMQHAEFAACFLKSLSYFACAVEVTCHQMSSERLVLSHTIDLVVQGHKHPFYFGDKALETTLCVK